MTKHRSVINCLRCKRERKHAGRGLCPPCHIATGHDGTRENYPLIGNTYRGAPTVRPVPCICCGRSGRHEGRGLIKACYKRHVRNGTLQQFAKVQRAAKPTPRDNEALIPLAVLGALLIEASTELEEWAEEQLGAEVVAKAINAAESSAPARAA